ncbi:molybdopterin molybdotransferase MoeA [Streptomyces sp. S3(2020)]|uniref:molybdopterin molybdotransferase MoeA n=1 Tax=Streptomyces sp. S3(2020) TaxID=2732044 RepID=UPI001489122E|nr:molybdopterin molybdotransferase MoeA [Streptomyces sp. S3(2020)]NNN30418.1 molybdopterin molybdotransferase MoeA [Streptomyces sp. S3(2020)]
MTVLATAPAPPASCRDLPWESARERAHAAPALLPAQHVPLARAAGLALADVLRTPQPMPGFDTAAMDGYAVGPGAGPWRVRGMVRAGGAWTGGPLGTGEAVEISTGAAVPVGARAVIPLERVERSGPLVRGPSPAEGKHIRRAGEDAPAGSPLAPAGTRIGPALLGLAAASGHDTLPVRPRPWVRILVTGDELTHTGRPGPGRVRDALGPLLPPLIQVMGGETTDVHHVPDQPTGSLATAVHTRLSSDADVTVVTGSTSVGATDQLRMLLADADARWVVDAVACRPGHPQLLAQLPNGHWVLGLPGNPYAALVAAHTLLAGDIRTAPGRTRLIPVSWDGVTAHPVGGHRPAFLHGAALADALAAVPPDWQPGQPVPLLLLAG